MWRKNAFRIVNSGETREVENSTVFRYKASNFDSLGIKSFKAAVIFEGDSLYVEYKFVVVDSVNL